MADLFHLFLLLRAENAITLFSLSCHLNFYSDSLKSWWALQINIFNTFFSSLNISITCKFLSFMHFILLFLYGQYNQWIQWGKNVMLNNEAFWTYTDIVEIETHITIKEGNIFLLSVSGKWPFLLIFSNYLYLIRP